MAFFSVLEFDSFWSGPRDDRFCIYPMPLLFRSPPALNGKNINWDCKSMSKYPVSVIYIADATLPNFAPSGLVCANEFFMMSTSRLCPTRDGYVERFRRSPGAARGIFERGCTCAAGSQRMVK